MGLALEAWSALRNAGFGRDTWMAAEKGRLIARSFFGKKKSLVEQVLEIESVSKTGRAKAITGNFNSSYKGGKTRKRASKVDELPCKSKEIIETSFVTSGATPSSRSSWLKTDAFDNLCRELHYHHSGEIIRHIINFAKRFRQNIRGVYFNVDSARPHEYNVGRTGRCPSRRLEDTGSKGRHWKTVAWLPNASENEIHKLLAKWKDHNGRGSETFCLDEESYTLIFEKYKLPHFKYFYVKGDNN